MISYEMLFKLTYLTLYQDIFNLGWTEVVLQLQADMLGSIPASFHNGLRKRYHDWLEGGGGCNFS